MRGAGRRAASVAMVLAAALVVTACRGGAPAGGAESPAGGAETAPATPAGGTETAPAVPAGGVLELTQQKIAFRPDTLSGAPGAVVTVRVTNKDGVLHSFTLDDGSVDQDVPSGETVEVSVTLPASGSLGFHCKYHPSMTGTISVG